MEPLPCYSLFRIASFFLLSQTLSFNRILFPVSNHDLVLQLLECQSEKGKESWLLYDMMRRKPSNETLALLKGITPVRYIFLICYIRGLLVFDIHSRNLNLPDQSSLSESKKDVRGIEGSWFREKQWGRRRVVDTTWSKREGRNV